MAYLTLEQIKFLKSQNIALAQVFDASLAKSAADRMSQMEELELSFYYGSTSCKKSGHTLRSKAGKCIQCDTSQIAYQLRNSASGYVYLAFSQNTKLIKIGYTKNLPEERAAKLRAGRYAEASDWVIKITAYCEKNAGKKEFLIQSSLEKYLKPVPYEKYPGQIVICREVFECHLNLAIDIFAQITGQ